MEDKLYCSDCQQYYGCECEETDALLDRLTETVGLPTFTFRALCTSERCTKIETGVVKDVGSHTSDCPDCGHALFWERTKV